MCVQEADEPLRDYVTRWTELRNSCEGVHEVRAIQYFIDGCRDGTLLKHKLMCTKPTSLAVLMAKADKYTTADSAMRVKVTALDKIVPTSATPKLAGDNRGGQKNYKRKADQMDPRSNSKLVASVEGKTSAPQTALHESAPTEATPTGCPSSPSSSFSTPHARYILGRSHLPTPFDSVALRAGCRKEMACRLIRPFCIMLSC
ncbi:hypothetical protein ZWY2020_006434 [Hordeum vulgare]|nr:hypothetical protein ZWY2020_006434 [Hordeum vulgare]